MPWRSRGPSLSNWQHPCRRRGAPSAPGLGSRPKCFEKRRQLGVCRVVIEQDVYVLDRMHSLLGYKLVDASMTPEVVNAQESLELLRTHDPPKLDRDHVSGLRLVLDAPFELADPTEPSVDVIGLLWSEG